MGFLMPIFTSLASSLINSAVGQMMQGEGAAPGYSGPMGGPANYSLGDNPSAGQFATGGTGGEMNPEGASAVGGHPYNPNVVVGGGQVGGEEVGGTYTGEVGGGGFSGPAGSELLNEDDDLL